MNFRNKGLNNLYRKLLFAIILWLLGALFFVGLTLNISWRLEDRGVAINEAGSLRKLSYLMVAMVQSQQTKILDQQLLIFEAKLKHLSQLETGSSSLKKNTEHISELHTVINSFQIFKKKILEKQNNPALHANLLDETHEFIEQINHLVKSIELENTHNIQLMRLAQILLMLMAFVSALLSLFLLNKLVIRPLSILNTGLHEITTGNLSTRLDIRTDDEFHQVSDGFNQMASSLQDVYQNLEEKVRQKTADLKQTNTELSVLYEITALLHKGSSNPKTLNMFLEKVIQLSNAKAGSIRLLNQQGQKMEIAAAINIPDGLLTHPACLSAHCCLCGQALKETEFISYSHHNSEHNLPCHQYKLDDFATFQMQLRDQPFGLLTIYFDQASPENSFDSPLIRLLCTQLAVAIENDRLILRDKQYAVLEERNIMAQGLHDSIAQSLSFLNLQLQMLNKAIENNNKNNIDQHFVFLNTGLQQCYDDVRELLNNFRFKLNTESFQGVMQSVIERFKLQTSIPVKLSFTSTGADLTPQQQLQIIFIVQEALSNIRKHAQASEVLIEFKNDQDIFLNIQDNGIGFDLSIDKENQGHHIGLSIMKERIDKINGQLHIISEISCGTSIQVSIQHHQR